MDPRTEHLIALVKGGATLGDAGRVYGISRERVRQILKGEGLGARELPGRAQRRRGSRFVQAMPVVEEVGGRLPVQLAPVIEAMRSEGMLYHEIAAVFDVSCDAVHQLIRERMPQPERSAQTTAVLKDDRSAQERHLAGMRRAASVLAQSFEIDAEERRYAQAVIDRRLDAHPESADAADGALRSEPTETAEPAEPVTDASSLTERVSPAELRGELERFKAELRAGGLRESTIHSYLMGSSLFVRWLTGDYVPGTRRERTHAAERAL